MILYYYLEMETLMTRNIAWILCLSLTLLACSDLQNTQQNQHALCKEIKRQIIVNGATSNQHLAIKQRAEMEGLTRSYHEQGCKQ